jgi:hypothetical protein
MNQERQKTVIAFVAGLLIGGLLVWVFTLSSGTKPSADMGATKAPTATEEAMPEDGGTDVSTGATGTIMNEDADDTTATPTSAAQRTGDGALDVNDQPAGSAVVISDIDYPSVGGWIVVRDYQNGSAGSILGAARYDTAVGLTPTSVSLLRATQAGATYEVVFYSEDGDRAFSTASDTEMSGTATATFTAQ